MLIISHYLRPWPKRRARLTYVFAPKIISLTLYFRYFFLATVLAKLRHCASSLKHYSV